MRDPANLPALLQSFFTTRLMAQRKVSPHTIASYHDTFRLLLQFAQKRLRKAPSQMGLDDLDASLVGAFLEDLENRRHNGARSRNLRLTAIRSFFSYFSSQNGRSDALQRCRASERIAWQCCLSVRRPLADRSRRRLTFWLPPVPFRY
jgi:integrase/recombinase XerD